MERFILTFSCPDTIGIVAAVAAFLAQNQGFINESQQFGDVTTDKFFMRMVFTTPKTNHLEIWETKFNPIAKQFNMRWNIQSAAYRPRVLILVSKLGHCLNGLLNKHSMGNLAIEIAGIVSNHSDLAHLAQSYEIPFYEFPITPETKIQQEAKIQTLINQLRIELIVLARYMQILTPEFVKTFEGQIINIHHSFLPSFKGAHPYQQAFDKGVKLIGATAHYVTSELDEGPIIEQEVSRVSHAHTPADLTVIGQDIEQTTLIKAVKWHVEQRVFLNGRKTVVFN